MSDRAIWGIHMAHRHGGAPVAEGYVALGWSDVGDLSRIAPAREAFKAAYTAAYPDATQGNVAVSAGVLFRFANEVKVGDLVVYPSKPDRMVNIGTVTGGYRFDPTVPEECPNVRQVEWRRSIPRAEFSQPALNEIGSALSLFRVTNNADEFLAALAGQPFATEAADEASAERAAVQAQESTEDFIVKRLKAGQSAYQFEHFVAHLLRCMGYYSRVTQASSCARESTSDRHATSSALCSGTNW
jgi:restriction system protein